MAPGTAPGTSGTSGTGPVLLGFRYYTDDSSFAESLALRNAQDGDQRGYAQAVVADINAHGGLGGRKISVVYSGETPQDSIYNADGSDQAACAAFTQDHHVVAGLSLGQGKVLSACMAQHQLPFVEDNFGLFDLSKPSLTYNYFVPSQPSGPRSMKLLVDSLFTSNWFGPGAKIGAVESSNANRASSVQALSNALEAHHLHLSANVSYATPDQLSEALLKMQANGVNRLFVVEGSNGLETEVVMTQAQSQHYFPRYAIDTRSAPNFLQINAPATQLRGAAGIGWFPMYDTGADTSTPAVHCLAVIHRAGLTTPDALATRFALSTCDVFYFFRTLVERSGGLSSSNLIAAGNSLRGSFQPVGSFASWFSPAQHDGMSAFRPLAYIDSCSCFRYTGPTVDVG